MLIIQSKNEKELAVILESMEGCRVIRQDVEPRGLSAPLVIEGTCSACKYFESRRSDADRGQFVKWGMCRKLNANVNEHKQECSLMKAEREEAKFEKSEVRRVYVA